MFGGSEPKAAAQAGSESELDNGKFRTICGKWLLDPKNTGKPSAFKVKEAGSQGGRIEFIQELTYGRSHHGHLRTRGDDEYVVDVMDDTAKLAGSLRLVYKRGIAPADDRLHHTFTPVGSTATTIEAVRYRNKQARSGEHELGPGRRSIVVAGNKYLGRIRASIAGGAVLPSEVAPDDHMREVYEEICRYRAIDMDDGEGHYDEDDSFVDTLRFDLFMCVVIIANAIAIALEVDAGCLITDEPRVYYWYVEEFIFACLFTAEFLLKLREHGAAWIVDDLMNFWVATVMLLVVVDMLLDPFEWIFDIRIPLNGYVRLISLGRIIYFIRVERRMMRSMSWMKELKLVLDGMVVAGRALFWLCLLLAFFLYICSILTTSSIGGRMDIYDDYRKLSGGWDANEHFGTVSRSLRTLMRMVTLDGWSSEIARHVVTNQSEMGLFFLMLIALTTFCIANVVFAYIVEHICSLASKDQNKQRVRADRKKMSDLDVVNEIFARADSDHSGEIEVEEFIAACNDPKIIWRFKNLDIHIEDAARLFEVVDGDGSQALTQEQFQQGCMKLKGVAQSKDLLALSAQADMVASKMDDLHERLIDMEEDLATLDEITFNLSHRFGSTMVDVKVKKNRQTGGTAPTVPIKAPKAGSNSVPLSIGNRPDLPQFPNLVIDL